MVQCIVLPPHSKKLWLLGPFFVAFLHVPSVGSIQVLQVPLTVQEHACEVNRELTINCSCECECEWFASLWPCDKLHHLSKVPPCLGLVTSRRESRT